jgi:hypothetical protein
VERKQVAVASSASVYARVEGKEDAWLRASSPCLDGEEDASRDERKPGHRRAHKSNQCCWWATLLRRGWEVVAKDSRSRTGRNPYKRPLTSWLRGANGSVGLGVEDTWLDASMTAWVGGRREGRREI